MSKLVLARKKRGIGWKCWSQLAENLTCDVTGFGPRCHCLSGAWPTCVCLHLLTILRQLKSKLYLPNPIKVMSVSLAVIVGSFSVLSLTHSCCQFPLLAEACSYLANYCKAGGNAFEDICQVCVGPFLDGVICHVSDAFCNGPMAPPVVICLQMQGIELLGAVRDCSSVDRI